MYKYKRELTIKEVTDQLYQMLDYRQVEAFPEYEPKTHKEHLYVLYRLIRALEQGGDSRDKRNSEVFQAAKRLMGLD